MSHDSQGPMSPPQAPPQYALPQQPPQYAPPQYAPPQPPQYAHQPFGYAAPGAQWVPAPSGRKFWALGFLTYIPLLGWCVAAILLLIKNAEVRKNPAPVVRENARWAANWILTVGVAWLLGFSGLMTAAIVGQVSVDAGGRGDVLMPLVVMSAVFLVIVQIAHFVVSLVGVIVADQRVWDPVVVIRFFRPV